MKILIKLVVVVVLIAAVAVGAAFYYVDALAKTAIERGGTTALGVQTTVSSTDVGILDGTFSLSGLHVANPAGFSDLADDRLRDAFLAPEQVEDLLANEHDERLVVDPGVVDAGEGNERAVARERAVRDDGVDMRMPMEELPRRARPQPRSCVSGSSAGRDGADGGQQIGA